MFIAINDDDDVAVDVFCTDFPLFSASAHRLFPRNLPHHGVDAVGPAQDHRLPPALVRGPHQGLPLPNTPGGEVPAHQQDHPQGHQARQPSRQLKLCSQNL